MKFQDNLRIKISPIAFLVVKDGVIKLLTIDADRPLDKLVDALPDLVNKIVDTVDKSLLKSGERLKVNNSNNSNN